MMTKIAFAAYIAGRAALIGSIAASLLMTATPLRAETSEPAAVVRNFDDALLNAMGQAKTLGYRGRYEILAPAVSKTFDVSAMTRIAVGRAWTGLSESQKTRLTDAFGHFIAATFASRFDDYGGEKFEVAGARPMSAGVLVENQLVKPSGERVTINYLTHQTPDGWEAFDVFLDGTISELAVRRSEFTAILERSDPDALIATLELKTRQLAMD